MSGAVPVGDASGTGRVDPQTILGDGSLAGVTATSSGGSCDRRRHRESRPRTRSQQRHEPVGHRRRGDPPRPTSQTDVRSRSTQRRRIGAAAVRSPVPYRVATRLTPGPCRLRHNADRDETGPAPAPQQHQRDDPADRRRTADNNSSEFTDRAATRVIADQRRHRRRRAPDVTVDLARRQDRHRRHRRSPPFDLAATGGTPPYTWAKVGLPAGDHHDRRTAPSPARRPRAGNYDPVVEATDSASPRPRPTTETFTFTITRPLPSLTRSPTIQGTGATTPFDGQATSPSRVW